jgi:hypothetical protein
MALFQRNVVERRTLRVGGNAGRKGEKASRDGVQILMKWSTVDRTNERRWKQRLLGTGKKG